MRHNGKEPLKGEKMKVKKILALILALAMALSVNVPVFAESASAEKFAYSGEEVNFIDKDGKQFGMFTPLEGTAAVIEGSNVVIHYLPKNTTVYNGLHWGSKDDSELTRAENVNFNKNGSIDITLPSEGNAGYALPVAVLKEDGTSTSSQYYLAIPSADKLEGKSLIIPFAYSGSDIAFIDAGGEEFGMLLPKEDGLVSAAIVGDYVSIHYEPKTETYTALHWGKTDECGDKDNKPSEDVKLINGAYDFTLSKTDCGKAIPVAPLKESFSKSSWSSSKQYYFALPAEEILRKLGSGAIPYDGDAVQAIKVDRSPFGMMEPQGGTTAEINGSKVLINYVPKNTTTYTAIHWGLVDDEKLTRDVEIENGSFDIKLPKSKCEEDAVETILKEARRGGKKPQPRGKNGQFVPKNQKPTQKRR